MSKNVRSESSSQTKAEIESSKRVQGKVNDHILVLFIGAVKITVKERVMV
jgi:hypothetical protein